MTCTGTIPGVSSIGWCRDVRLLEGGQPFLTGCKVVGLLCLQRDRLAVAKQDHWQGPLQKYKITKTLPLKARTWIGLFFPKQVYLWGSLLEKNRLDTLLGALGLVGRGFGPAGRAGLGWAWGLAVLGALAGLGVVLGVLWVGRGVWLCWARWLGWAWGLAVLGALAGLGVVLGVLGALAGLGVVLGVGFGRASWVGRGVGRGVWPCWARWLGWAWCWACWAR